MLSRPAAWVTAGFLILVIAAGCEQIRTMTAEPIPASVGEGGKLLRVGEKPKATVQFDAAIKERSGDFSVYVAILDECGKAGQRDLIATYSKRAIDSIPVEKKDERARIHLVAGAAYDRMGDLNASIAENEQAYQLAPGDPMVMNGLGYAYAQQGINLTRAIQLTAESLRLLRDERASDELLGTVADSLGWAYYKNGQIDEAVQNLAHAVDLSPQREEIHYHLGMAYRAKGRDEDARIEFQRALAIAPDSPQLKQALDDTNRRIAARKARAFPPSHPGPR